MVMIANQNYILTYFAVSYVLFESSLVAEGFIGMNWGRMASQRMIPSMVVDMMLQNNITNVKTYSASKNVLEAFGGTGIQLATSLPNADMKTINTTEDAGRWIADRIKPYQAMNITFRYVYVGTGLLSLLSPLSVRERAVSTLGLMQRALEINNVTGVKATFSNGAWDLLLPPQTYPSMAEIHPELKDHVIQCCTICKQYNIPFGIDIYPLGTDINGQNDTEFYFFENNSTAKFKDGEFFYNNGFEVIYDSVVVALEKLGCSEVPILLGAIGWPTDGKVDANIPNAERFHQGLVKFIRSQKGTPRRPGNIDVYIHNIADENALMTKNPIPFMRHWGIYKFDGQPKFNLDFTGKERKVKPVSAVGISHMPKRWCILDTSKINPNRIPFEALDAIYNSTCEMGDCSSNSPGGSCSDLSYPKNYSYAFNAGFQSSKQNLRNNSCDYGGYGVLVSDDPSTPTCTFPIEIIAAETTNFLGYSMSSTLRPSFAFAVFVVFKLLLILPTWI